jgi:hypothetical protein
MYDQLTNTRFDMHHPIWISHMVNKGNGKIKTKWDGKLAFSLQAKGLIKLSPSVTEIASIADGKGAFSAGVAWVLSQSGKMYESIRANATVMPPSDVFKSSLSAALTEARDKGSHLHDAFEQYKLNPLSKADMDEEQLAMVEICCTYLDTNWPDGTLHCKSEVQFCNKVYGGTADVVLPSVAIVDWKTVSKKRAFKASEVIQSVAYAMHFGVTDIRVVMISQKTMSICNELRLTPEVILAMTPIVNDTFKFAEDLKRIKEIAGL